MRYEIEKTSKAITVIIAEQLIYSDMVAFAKVLDEVKNSGAPDCVLQLRDLDHIDSSGLRMIFLLHDVCKEKTGLFSVSQARGQVRDMLLHCKFDRLLQID